MSESQGTAQKRTARYDHLHRLGVDGEGAVHRYRPGDRTILVVQDGQVEYRQSLSARSVRAWVDHVDECRGWAEDPTVGGLANAVAATLGEH